MLYILLYLKCFWSVCFGENQKMPWKGLLEAVGIFQRKENMPGPYFQSVAPILEDELDNTVLSCLFVLMVMHCKTRVKFCGGQGGFALLERVIQTLRKYIFIR